MRGLVRVEGNLDKVLSKTKFMRRCLTHLYKKMNVTVVFNQAPELYHYVCNQVRIFTLGWGMFCGLY
jgi:hypothetical protein